MFNTNTAGVTTADVEATITAAERLGGAINQAEELGMDKLKEALSLLILFPLLDPRSLDVLATLTGARK